MRLQRQPSAQHFLDFDERLQDGLVIKNDRLYSHKKMSMHYTTYDIRRGLDVINLPSGKCDIMVSSCHANYPFRYARVIGIFHVITSTPSTSEQHFDLLWVRWFESVQDLDKDVHLDVVRFESNLGKQFGFLNPGDVIRACHIIPDWSHGLVPPSQQHVNKWKGSSEARDYQFYYVNKYVRRSLLEILLTVS
jgi:hypothetical protein